MPAGCRSPRVDGAFSVIAGQARWGNVVARGEGGDLAVTGTVDLSEWALDARLTLSGPAGNDPSTSGRPDVFIALKGPIAAPKRTLDVSALTGWLTLRVGRAPVEADRGPGSGAAGGGAARGRAARGCAPGSGAA